jgi:hypothetical protein
VVVTTPRAAGVRLPYDDVPDRVRAWVDEALGSPVVATAEQVGGMSPGCATRVRCADGTRAFVKAVGADLNPDTPGLFRREAAVLQGLGGHDLWAGFLAAYDDGNWVALLLQDVDGSHPDLSDDAVMAAVLAGTDTLGAELRARVSSRPEAALNLSQVFDRWAGFVREAEVTPAAPVPDWVRREAAAWSERIAALAGTGPSQLLHWDIRNDNLLRRPSGEIVFVDWGAAAYGPAWCDPLLARLERVDEAWFDASVPTSPALAEAGDDAVTAWLVGLGTLLAVRSVTAVDVNLPTLNDFRVRESRRLLAGTSRRLDR